MTRFSFFAITLMASMAVSCGRQAQEPRASVAEAKRQFVVLESQRFG